jgi:NADH-quinone oxidoreductase subunit N
MIGFQSADLFGLLPALLLVLTGMAVLLLEVFQRASFPRTHLAYVTALGALLAAGVAYLIAPAAPQTLWGGMVRFDALGCVITAFTAVACAITALGSTRYLEQLEIDRGEYYALLLFATAGMSVMSSASRWAPSRCTRSPPTSAAPTSRRKPASSTSCSARSAAPCSSTALPS